MGVAISAAALWLTLRREDLGTVWAAVLEADYWFVLAYLVVTGSTHFLRAARWGILLEPMGGVRFAKLNASCAVGFMAALVLPLRLGELARPLLVSDPPRLRFPAALSTLVVERVVDGVCAALLLVVTLLAVPRDAPGVAFLRAGGLAVFAAFMAALAFLALAYFNGPAAIRVAHRILDPVSPSLANRVSETAGTFVQGLRNVPTRRGVASFVSLTIAFWILGAWSIQILARGFAFHLTLMQAFTVLAILSVGMMIPAGPAMVGTFQAAAVLGLAVFFPGELVRTRGTAFANVLWGAQLVQVVGFGVVFLFSRHLQLERLHAGRAGVPQS